MKYRILVVDDEPGIARILEEFLTRVGFKVTKALGGKEAIEFIYSGIETDLIILDIKMPAIDGFDVLEEMKRINRNTPTIIFTGSIDFEKYRSDLERLRYSAADVLYKPIDLNMLLDLVRKKLRIKA